MFRGLNKIFGYRKFFQNPHVPLFESCNFATASKTATVKKLPRLPVPKLRDTLNKYLRSVRPFLDENEFHTTVDVVTDFEHNWGPRMQAILVKRAKSRDNWLDEWWLNAAYLEQRPSLILHSSPGVILPTQKFKSQNEQLQFTARILIATLDYKTLIDTKKLPRDMMGKHPLDMGQYEKVLGTCRIPLYKRDRLSFNHNSRHIIVMHNRHIFRVDLWGEDNERLNEEQIIDQLKKVVEQSGELNKKGVGILTTDNRDNWAKAYEYLSKDETNRKHLADIEKSMVAVCLDRPTDIWKLPNDDAQRTLAGNVSLHGGGPKNNGYNRWTDKTIQFIIGAEGLAAIAYEHSPADGQPVAVLVDYVMNQIYKGKIDRTPSKSPKPPRILDFNIDSNVTGMMKTAEANLTELLSDFDLDCFQYKTYGKRFIKTQKLSPDSYIQMALQYAFYRLYKVPGATYESAATRMYTGGRTETIRSCALESLRFCKTMLNTESSCNQKIQALKRAIKIHKKYTIEALQGKGVDRHLLGLKLAANENGIPLHKLYSDPSYTKSSHMRISTSQVKFRADAVMCYGPPVKNGYAMCYSPLRDSMNFALAAFEKHLDIGPAKFKEAVEQSLQEMYDILLKTKEDPVVKKKKRKKVY